LVEDPRLQVLQSLLQLPPDAVPVLLNVSTLHLQSEQDVLPADEKLFGGQDRVQPDDVSPEISPYVLAGQGVHDVDPGSEYEPARHTLGQAADSVICPVKVPHVPAGHKLGQASFSVVLPTTLPHLPAGQD
jgi:hypothetical protein